MKNIFIHEDEAIDLFMSGRLSVIQSITGYRFSVDAIHLALFVKARARETLIDLGTGCGIIPMIILKTTKIHEVWGLEIQEELASQAARNAKINNLQDKMKIVKGDIRHPPFRRECADIITCNPPYRKKQDGRLNPDHRKAIARHEILADMSDIFDTAKYLLKKGGKLILIYPTEKLADLFSNLRQKKLEPKRIRINYPSIHNNAKLVLVEAILDGKPGLTIEPPLLGQEGTLLSDFPDINMNNYTS